MQLLSQKIEQAIDLLKELRIDMWLIFVRESSTMPDPAIDMVVGQHCTWQTAWILTSAGDRIVIAGSLDIESIKAQGQYTEIIPYVQGIREDLVKIMKRLRPNKIAVNYSADSVMADGLTHGMYLQLLRHLDGTPYAKRIVSAEEIISRLRGRKSHEEIRRMRKAIKLTIGIFDKVTGFLAPGKSEQDVANFILKEVGDLGVGLAWDKDHCPAVFTGPEHAGAHFAPTVRKIKGGHVLNIDFGIKVDGYCSDLQRTWYIRKKGETDAPDEVCRGFKVIIDSITAAAKILKPGAVSWKVDAAARKYIESQGYPEYPHALGHQIGRAAHDGGIGLYPKWERYGAHPMGKAEIGQVFTIEPRLPVEGFGVATVEEMVVVTSDGCKFLSPRQKHLFVV